jgi:hypothetical protein
VGQRVLAVKIDNTRLARPQLGLEAADVVYVEEVEGGLTRLAAIFSSRLPSRLGPVRSVRETDLQLLGAYGRVAFAFSGGNPTVLSRVRSSTVADVSFDRVPAAYSRVSGRHAPYNLYTRPDQLLAARTKTAAATYVGFRFGTLTATAGVPAAGFDIRYKRASLTWTWDAVALGWRLRLDGTPDVLADGTPVSADNVIVQYVTVNRSSVRDVNGEVSPISQTIGSGPALYFRDGLLMRGTWARGALAAPTRYLDTTGQPVLLKPGHTWVVMVRKGSVVPVR